MAAEQREATMAAPMRAVMARPGALLRAAREAAGMSLDQVAQQLKLAPRQVKALEDEDFAHLPGRTFTRGFVRNYARLMNLDAGELLARLPDAAEAPELGSPMLHATGSIIGELPSSETRSPSFARWLIPLLLVACVVLAAGYEWYRGGLSAPGESAGVVATAPKPVESGPGAPAPTSVALPNPLSGEATPAPAAATSSTPAESAPAALPAAPPAARLASAAPAVEAASAPSPAEVVAPAAVPAQAAPLVLTYRGPSWTEIRDRNGQVLIARLVAAGSQESIRGAAPFELTIGNASEVRLSYLGQPVDLKRFTAHNVARLRLLP